MLVVSLFLIAGAAVLLVLGLWQSSAVLLASSIAASLCAAVLLVVGARRVGSSPAAGADRSFADDDLGEEPGPPPGPVDNANAQTMTIPAQGGSAPPPHQAPPPPHQAPPHQGPPHQGPPPQGPPQQYGPQHAPPTSPPADAAEYLDDEDPPDEPAPQQVSPADAARVGRMLNEVLVVDGRPRYHLPGCVHLLGRESEPLPVSEAIELGFTPCSLCEPDSALLADARRV
ncbi:MAG TPA: hypothetical protein VIL37_08950 [Natronosporangium sp.]